MTKSKKFIALLLAVVFLVSLPSCDGGEKKKKYEAALEIYESGNYEEAVIQFEELENYKDSADKAKECHEKIEAARVAREAACLDELKTLYYSIDTICQADKKLADAVNTVYNNAKTVDDKMQAYAKSSVLSYLYKGEGYEASTSTSLINAIRIQNKLPSASIYEGSSGYTVYVTVCSNSEARQFKSLLDDTDSLMKRTEKAISEMESVPEKYQAVFEKITETAASLKGLHSYVNNVPQNPDSIQKDVQGKSAAISLLLKEIKEMEPMIA